MFNSEDGRPAAGMWSDSAQRTHLPGHNTFSSSSSRDTSALRLLDRPSNHSYSYTCHDPNQAETGEAFAISLVTSTLPSGLCVGGSGEDFSSAGAAFLHRLADDVALTSALTLLSTVAQQTTPSSAQ